MRHALIQFLRRGVAGALLAAGLSGGLPALAQTQQCIDNSVIRCFNGCNDPSNFQECIIGCATGANSNPQNCTDQCFNDPTCLAKCNLAIEHIRSCAAPSSKLAVAVGTPTYNRNSRIWQQTVRVSNSTQTDVVGNIAVLLEGVANGWTVANATGSTGALGTGGPYLDLSGVQLQPGESMLVRLVYSRTGALPFSLAPRAYSSVIR